ncbi:TPA: hypothetical protein ACX6RM_001306 [Photobacterium damselae]
MTIPTFPQTEADDDIPENHLVQHRSIELSGMMNTRRGDGTIKRTITVVPLICEDCGFIREFVASNLMNLEDNNNE